MLFTGTAKSYIDIVEFNIDDEIIGQGLSCKNEDSIQHDGAILYGMKAIP